MLFFSFFFTKLDQMSRVGSRGRHPKCRPKNQSSNNFFLSDRNGGRLKVSHTQKNKGFDYLEQRKQTQLLWKGPSIEMLGESNFMPLLL